MCLTESIFASYRSASVQVTKVLCPGNSSLLDSPVAPTEHENPVKSVEIYAKLPFCRAGCQTLLYYQRSKQHVFKWQALTRAVD